MPFSFHSHSGEFCKHASGTLEEVVQAAILAKFRVYGLTEHVPRYRLEDKYPEEVCWVFSFLKIHSDSDASLLNGILGVPID